MERASELKRWSSANQCMLFCRGSILLTCRKMTGWQGFWIPRKSDDVIYEQPLTNGSQLTFRTQLEKVLIFCLIHFFVTYGGPNWPFRCLEVFWLNLLYLSQISWMTHCVCVKLSTQNYYEEKFGPITCLILHPLINSKSFFLVVKMWTANLEMCCICKWIDMSKSEQKWQMRDKENPVEDGFVFSSFGFWCFLL